MYAHAQTPRDREPAFEALASDVENFESIIAHWDESQRSVAFAYRQSIDALNKAALRRLIAEVKSAPGAQDALRKAAGDPLVYAVLRHHGLIQPSLQEKLERALASVQPMLGAHGGGVELVAITPPDTVDVRFLGNCDGCSASMLTFVEGVKRAIEEHCPEIKHVRQVKGLAHKTLQTEFTSPFVETNAWSFAAESGDVPDGGILAITVKDTAVLLGRTADIIVCYHDACAHLGLGLCPAANTKGNIFCAHHEFEYNLMTGECLTVPEVQLRPIPARVNGTRIEIKVGGS